MDASNPYAVPDNKSDDELIAQVDANQKKALDKARAGVDAGIVGQLGVASDSEDEALAAKKAELDALDQEIASLEAPEDTPVDPEREAMLSALDKEIAEKKKQLADLKARGGTKGQYADTRMDRGRPVSQPANQKIPERVHIDSRGQIFDPEVHHMDGDKPYRDSVGSFVSKTNGYTPPGGVANFGQVKKEE